MLLILAQYAKTESEYFYNFLAGMPFNFPSLYNLSSLKDCAKLSIIFSFESSKSFCTLTKSRLFTSAIKKLYLLSSTSKITCIIKFLFRVFVNITLKIKLF